MKNQTVRFYTNGSYQGWKYAHNVTFREARNWLRSGNSLIIDKKVLNSFASETSILKIFTT